LNPAMGWLFAVGLGLHRKSRATAVMSLLPIAAGHALSIGVVAFIAGTLGLFVDERILECVAGILLIGWSIYHQVYGHRHRVRAGMTTGMLGLGAWSFVMATAHGAGLMLVPVVMPLCLSSTPAHELTAGGALPVALAAIATHMTAMLAVILIITLLV